MNTHIALDGPLNGTYITEQQAADNDYALTEWTTGEYAYVHLPNVENFTGPDGVPVELAEETDDE